MHLRVLVCRYATLASIPDLYLGGHARVCVTLRGCQRAVCRFRVHRTDRPYLTQSDALAWLCVNRFDGAFTPEGGTGSEEAGVSVTTLCERLSRSGICGVVAMRVPFNFAVDEWAARMVRRGVVFMLYS